MRLARMTLAVVALALAQCGTSHQVEDAGSPSVDAGPRALGRCTAGSCSWDDRCPTDPEPAVGSACDGPHVYCAYCRDGSFFDEITLVCRDGHWDRGVCGCGCP